MGNNQTREERAGSHHGAGQEPGRHGEVPGTRRSNRPELISLSSSRHHDVPFERRETRQEREARKLEKERAARLKERERSMKEEHVDGGYLVTMGIYTASEDFNKQVVRQLQIERRIAPFWRGLDDFDSTWTEHQITAAARGLEIPPADQVPEHLIPRPVRRESPEGSSANLSNLTVPMGGRTLSSSSDRGASAPTSKATSKVTSPLKQPKRTLAAALNLSRNSSQADIAPREMQLPHDPFVNGQALEVFLYKAGEECPVCLMYYPPYLNRTRCCCQLICSECFVQIKRPDPHLPDHHGDDTIAEGEPSNVEENSERLIMEPARCPYCTQSDFGVTYEPPPFRRGLVYSSASGLGAMSPAMSSTSSLNANILSTPASSSRPSRKRAQSLSANAPGVVTADRIRPDWAGKLATARAHQRRRAAAADALHHAAFVMGNQESRTFFGRSSRFSRRPGGSGRGSETPGGTNANDGPDEAQSGQEADATTSPSRGGQRERIDAAQLENLMMAEAIRLSLADEEERRKKADKEARKEAKKREKEERKAAKKGGGVYGSGSASASSLSLRLGRRRNNSESANLRVEASVAAATTTASAAQGSEPGSASNDKGKGVERGVGDEASNTVAPAPTGLPIPTASQIPRGSSHLRQMSNASSISSSGIDSMPGSYTGKGRTMDTQGSALSIDDQGEQGDSGSSEPLFNFRSLAEVVGVSIDGKDGGSEWGNSKAKTECRDDEDAHGEHIEYAPERKDEEDSRYLAKGPDVVITPETPFPQDDDDTNLRRV
ncbi:hypothetical protein GGS20DRAFT_186472 [Poronia punctata]|nr:hypothetical protein GGS20DRAFT_186472 [Poronia punctata]